MPSLLVDNFKKFIFYFIVSAISPLSCEKTELAISLLDVLTLDVVICALDSSILDQRVSICYNL